MQGYYARMGAVVALLLAVLLYMRREGGSVKNERCVPVVWSSEELASHTIKDVGQAEETPLYLALLGNVFDVSVGRDHYRAGAPYHSFIGADRSRSFVDGEFGGSERNREHVLDLSCADLHALQTWLQTYHTKYTYKGVVSGLYYDEAGCGTNTLAALQRRLEACSAPSAPPALPPCNVEWSSQAGSRVWCSTNSGGVARAWTGVPRQGAGGECVCARGTEAGRLQPYPHCAPHDTRCDLSMQATHP